MDELKKIIDEVINFLSVPVFSIGTSGITLWTIIYLIFFLGLLYYLTTKANKIIVYKVLAKSKIELGVRIAVGSILRYVVLTVGFIIILQTVGINLSSITILLGALGVGIGFGLQNITNNIVSGLIILFERPIKVGDRIEVANISGDVVKVSIRSTTIVTNDNISVIVPNSEFISSTVVNWSYTDRNVRFNFPVGVSYKEDPERVKKILLEIALENSGVLKEPEPDILFTEYGDNALIFNLRVWTNEYIDKSSLLKSQLYFEIFKKFKEVGINIPFPQRDVHIKEMPNFNS